MHLAPLADTIATIERLDHRVVSLSLNPGDYAEFSLEIKEHITPFDSVNNRPGPDAIIVGIPQASMWGFWISTSESIPPGKLLILPSIEDMCVPECGASIGLAPFIDHVARAAVHEATVPDPGRGASRMRTEEDVQGMLKDLGPNPSMDQMNAWMGRKYPNG